jgi:hypothetical protein
MPKFTDFYSDPEVKTIMERFIEKFPGMFEGFNCEAIHVIFTKKKKSRKPVRLVPVRYPFDAFINKPYIVEVFEEWWQKFNAKQKNLAVFHLMCAVPEGGFDEQSSHYAKKMRPDVEMYLREFAASGGVPNWVENDAATDPMDLTPDAAKAIIPKIVSDGAADGEDDDEDPIPADPTDKATAPAAAPSTAKVKRAPVTKAVVASVGA